MKNNRKGFTIVELVIVIAVIAILAGVLIPTFAGITNKAKNNAALQEARNIYTVYVSQVNAQVEDEVYVKVEDKTFKVVKGQMEAEPIKTTPSTGIWVEKADEDTVTISCVATCADANTDNKCDVCGNCITHVDEKGTISGDTETGNGQCDICGQVIDN